VSRLQCHVTSDPLALSRSEGFPAVSKRGWMVDRPSIRFAPFDKLGTRLRTSGRRGIYVAGTADSHGAGVLR
jgi:hypothetical protein